LARKKAPRLVAKLRDAFVDKALIDVVVLVHVVLLGKAYDLEYSGASLGRKGMNSDLLRIN
jgi:hypothetical protein